MNKVAAFTLCTLTIVSANALAISAPFPISADCKTFIESLSKTYRYDWVESQDDPNDPKSKSIQVFYYYRPETGKVPIAFFNGGPGSDSHGENKESKNAIYKHHLFLIFIDQRGTGCSTSLPESESRTHLTNWGSVGIVFDAEKIRQKMGLGAWDIYGASYGAFVVQRYIQDFPQSLRHAVSFGGAASDDLTRFYQLRNERQLNATQLYLKANPGDTEYIVKIVKNNLCLFGNDPPSFSREYCGGHLMFELAEQYLGFRDWWSYIHSTLKDTAEKGVTHPEWSDPVTNTNQSNVSKFVAAEADMGIDDWTDCNKVKHLFDQEFSVPELYSFASYCWEHPGPGLTSEGKDYVPVSMELLKAIPACPIVQPISALISLSYNAYHETIPVEQGDTGVFPGVCGLSWFSGKSMQVADTGLQLSASQGELMNSSGQASSNRDGELTVSVNGMDASQTAKISGVVFHSRTRTAQQTNVKFFFDRNHQIKSTEVISPMDINDYIVQSGKMTRNADNHLCFSSVVCDPSFTNQCPAVGTCL